VRVLLFAVIVACHARQPVDVDDDDIPDTDDRCPDTLASACFGTADDGCPDPAPVDVGPEVGAAEKLDEIAAEVPSFAKGVKLHVRGEANGAHQAARALEERRVPAASIVIDVIQPAAPGCATITCE